MATKTNPIAYASELPMHFFGEHGLRYITSGNTSIEGECFYAIFANEDAVISATNLRAGTPTLTAVPIPAGATIYGGFTSVTVTTGKITAYLKENA